MKIIAIIPARGGSKSIPLKNIKILNGKPLIAYTIETATNSKIFDKIIVSTDHTKIAKICEKFSSVDIINRPAHLSLDTSSSESAILHACDVLNEHMNYTPDVIFTLEPTSPFRSINTILQCEKIIKKPTVSSVVSVLKSTEVFGIIDDGEFSLLNPNQSRRRQERKPVYKVTSTIFATKLKIIKTTNDVMGGFTAPCEVSREEAIDINNNFDLSLAEAMFQIRKNQK